jgi:cytochrome c5
MQDHAKNGFLTMPAEGQNSGLQELDLANAVYYITHRLRIRR